MSGFTYYNDIEHFPCEVLRKNIKLGLLPEGYVDERAIQDVKSADLVGYRHIHIFAGIGGFALGLKRAGVGGDVRLLSGGFPCQDIASPGSKVGISGPRSGLWQHMFRLIRDLRPEYALVENSSDLTLRGLDIVLGDLAGIGYDAEWQTVSAAALGAAHLRRRCIIVAYPQRLGQPQSRFFRQDAYTLQAFQTTWQTTRTLDALRRGTVPALCRGAYGLPYRMDRLTALGNAIIPQIAEYIGRCLIIRERAMREMFADQVITV